MKECEISIGGIRTSYVEAGEGRPIVFLHGSEFAADSRTSFLGQIRGLSADFRVIAVDNIHFGKTDYPADGLYRDRMDRVPHIAAFLEALALEDPILAGHSEGAFVAARIAVTRPGLLSGLVLLTSSSTAPAWGDDRDLGWAAASDALYDYHRPMPTLDQHMAELQAIFGPLEPEAARYRREAYLEAVRNGQWEIFRRAAQVPASHGDYVRMQEEQVLPFLGTVAHPALIIWSKDDPTAPVGRGALLSDLMPGADFHVLAGARHAVQTHRTPTVNALIANWAAA